MNFLPFWNNDSEYDIIYTLTKLKESFLNHEIRTRISRQIEEIGISWRFKNRKEYDFLETDWKFRYDKS